MKKPAKALTLAYLIVTMAEGPFAFAQPELPAPVVVPGSAGQAGAPGPAAPGGVAGAPGGGAALPSANGVAGAAGAGAAPPSPAVTEPPPVRSGAVGPGISPPSSPGATAAPTITPLPSTPVPAPTTAPAMGPVPSSPGPSSPVGSSVMGDPTRRRSPLRALPTPPKRTLPTPRRNRPATEAAAAAGATVVGPAAAAASIESPTSGAASASGGAVEVGGGTQEFNQCRPLPSGKRLVKFSFKPDSELGDIIGTISGITCRQFMYTSAQVANKKITIVSPQLVTPEEAYRVFLAAIEANGLTVEPMGRFLKIIESRNANRSNVPFYKDGESPGRSDKAFITRLVRLEYLDADDVTNKILTHLRSENGTVVPYSGSLIITDQSMQIERMLEILRQLDLPSVVREKIWMLRVKNMSATEMTSRLAEIFQIQQIGTGGRRPGAPGAPPPAPAGPRPPQQKVTTDLTSQMVITKLIPDDRSNHLIVMANDRAYEWLLTMVKRLDTPLEGGGDGRFHIYYCKNANCDELAATLAAMTGVSFVGGGGARRANRTSTSNAAAPPPMPAPGAGGPQGAQPQLFEGDVRVTFDAATNSLVVVSSLKDFQSLRRVIERLDGPRKQVYIEAMLMEVVASKNRRIGVGYHAGAPVSIEGKDSLAIGGFNSGQSLNPTSLLTDLGGLSGALFGPALSTITSRIFGRTTDIPSFGVAIKMLATNNDVNVLSAPYITIANNQEGEISVGKLLPFPGNTGLGNLGALAGQAGAAGLGLAGLGLGTSVQRQPVELRLRLVPSINEDNMIRLEVDVDIQDVLADNYNGLGPATSKRTEKTSIHCRDQQTVVLGGLMQDKVSESVSKVPILGDIPVIGFFFRTSDRSIEKSNIIIALTPYVINDMSDMRQIAEQKMRERREFIERFSKASDPVRWERNIDYRRKRGMLEEINRVARDIEGEESELKRVREKDLLEESTPIELPAGSRAGADEIQRPGWKVAGAAAAQADEGGEAVIVVEPTASGSRRRAGRRAPSPRAARD